MNHADGEIPAGANRQTLSGKIPNGANRKSAIGDLAGKVLPCGKSFDDVERFGKTGTECVFSVFFSI